MPEAYLGFGSNLDDKEDNLRQAMARLEEKCRVLKASSIYHTEPVGYKDQDWFLNGVAQVETDLAPRDLLGFLRSIEFALARVDRVPDGPRTIDLDILFYGDRVLREDDLVIPHPRLHLRRFVLVPLNEVAPELVHPVLERKVKDLLSRLRGPERVEIYGSKSLWQERDG